jgi:hypothetical protein
MMHREASVERYKVVSSLKKMLENRKLVISGQSIFLRDYVLYYLRKDVFRVNSVPAPHKVCMLHSLPRKENASTQEAGRTPYY